MLVLEVFLPKAIHLRWIISWSMDGYSLYTRHHPWIRWVRGKINWLYGDLDPTSIRRVHRSISHTSDLIEWLHWLRWGQHPKSSEVRVIIILLNDRDQTKVRLVQRSWQWMWFGNHKLETNQIHHLAIDDYSYSCSILCKLLHIEVDLICELKC